MVPNDSNIISQALSEIGRAKNLIGSAGSRLNDVLGSGNAKTNAEVEDINVALASMRIALAELAKVKLDYLG